MCQARGTMLCSSGLKSANGCAYVTPTTRSAAASPRIAAKASFAPPQIASGLRRGGGGSDVEVVSADELGNVPAGHDHGVHSCPLELGHLVPAADRQLRDRELAGRHVLQQVERSLQRALVAAVTGGQQEDLRVDALERGLQLLVVAHLDGALEPQVEHRAVGLLQLAVLASELGQGQYAGVRVRRTRPLGRAVRPPEQRQTRRLADGVDRVVERQRLGALLLGRARTSGIADGDDDRDPVALGDRLAEASCPGHLPGFWRKARRSAREGREAASEPAAKTYGWWNASTAWSPSTPKAKSGKSPECQ